jgi:hypothetical protein
LTGDLSLGTNDLTAQDITTTGAVSVGTGLTVGNGLTVSDGNVVMAAGHGIDFSATANSSGTMTSELLDDYEVGTFTPTFVNGGTGVYAQRSGKYAKIGNLVFASIHMQFSNAGTASGIVNVSGFPYATGNSPNNIYGHSSSIHGTGWAVNRSSLNFLINPNSAQTLSLYYNMAGQTGTWGQVTHADMATGNLLCNFTYLTD